jgi:hemerythrin
MPAFKWSKAHAIDVPELDAEHRSLYRAADELNRAIAAGAPPDKLLSTLRGLTAVVEDHLAHEERLMRSAQYPSYAWHKLQHDTVRKRMKKYLPAIEHGEEEAGVELLTFLSGWLRDHLGLTDRMMGSYLRNHRRQLAS